MPTINVKSIDWSKIHPLFYLLISLLLSTAITARFFLPLNPTILSTNYAFFVIFFIGLPVSAIVYLTLKIHTLKLSNKWFLLSLLFLVEWAALITLWATGNSLGYEYLYLWIPVPLAYFVSIKWNKKTKLFGSKRAKFLAVACFTLAIIVPNLAAVIGMNCVLTNAKSYYRIQDKVSYIDDRVNALTFYTWVFRSNLDNWKFLLSGAGQCGEMATASYNLMQTSGVDARIVDIPGEHSFVEVNLNGTWMVADGSQIISRNETAQKRIQDVGSLSYITAPSQNSFIELTQQYVPTDTIVITVTKNGEPIADAPVKLFRSGTLSAQLPSIDHSFYTDTNGIITLHLGKTYFIYPYQGTDNYYRIWVDGQKTIYTVTSTGTGQTTPVNVVL